MEIKPPTSHLIYTYIYIYAYEQIPLLRQEYALHLESSNVPTLITNNARTLVISRPDAGRSQAPMPRTGCFCLF